MAETATTKTTKTTKKATTTKKVAAAKKEELKPIINEEQQKSAEALEAEAEEEKAAMLRQIEELNAKLAAMQQTEQHRVAISNDDVVTVLFIDEVSPDNELNLPGYGTMRPGSYLDVPKKEFGGKFQSNLVRLLIKQRELLVVDGLTADERIRWNCDYKEGEVLTENAFDHLLDYTPERLRNVCDKLCGEHVQLVARRFIQAKERGDNRMCLEKAQIVNEISKKFDKRGMLEPVIEAFRQEI